MDCKCSAQLNYFLDMKILGMNTKHSLYNIFQLTWSQFQSLFSGIGHIILRQPTKMSKGSMDAYRFKVKVFQAGLSFRA